MTLSRFADVPPGAWEFTTGEYGKPDIAAPSTRLRCSLSPTAGMAACAVIRDRDIGVDVELRSRTTPIEVAARFFSSRETHDLLTLDPARQPERFLEYWTLKEAYLKARGFGLSLPLDQFSMHTTADGQWRIAMEPTFGDDRPGGGSGRRASAITRRRWRSDEHERIRYRRRPGRYHGSGYLNHRFLRLPATSGILAVALVSSLLVVAAEPLPPRTPDLQADRRRFLGQIDFNQTLMHGLLCFLLFAGALQVDLGGLVRTAGRSPRSPRSACCCRWQWSGC